MIVCNYCKAKKDTLNFCSTKHRVYYHRDGAKQDIKVEVKIEPIIDEVFLKIAEKDRKDKEKKKTAQLYNSYEEKLDGYCKKCGFAKTMHGTRYIKCKEFEKII